MKLFCIRLREYSYTYERNLYGPQEMTEQEFKELSLSICKDFSKNDGSKSAYDYNWSVLNNLEKTLIKNHGFCHPEWFVFELNEKIVNE